MISVIRLTEKWDIYLLLSKFEDDVIFEYHITINDEDFKSQGFVKTPEGTFL